MCNEEFGLLSFDWDHSPVCSVNCHKTDSCCMDMSFAWTNSFPECLAVGEQPKGNGVWVAEELHDFVHQSKAPCGLWILN